MTERKTENPRVVLLVKVFEREEHADDFLKSGRISAARLSSYRKTEDNERRDVDEGGVILLKPTVWVNHLKIPMERLRFDDGYEGLRYVFCMTHFLVDVDPSAPDRLREQIAKSLPRLERLGRYAVLIRNVSQFFDRVAKAIPSNVVTWEGSTVKYRDDSPQEQIMNLHRRDPKSALKRAFRKDPFFELEREWRLVLCDGEGGKDRRLNFVVGSLDDIAQKMLVRELGGLNVRYTE